MDKATKIAKRHCLFTLVSAMVVVVCVCIGITINLTTVYDENFDHMGLRTFAMFTVNSNILCGVTMMLVLPYAIDALRTHVFRLPLWVVITVFTGVTAVALTFLVSLCILAPVKGFNLIFSGSRFFLHGVCPVLAIIAFCFFISEHHIGFWGTFIALVPVFLYACLYAFPPIMRITDFARFLNMSSGLYLPSICGTLKHSESTYPVWMPW